ncbi:MAG TPA: DUF2070 family protein, partial [Thermoplasmata archaeon]|nr:DUF2070 family protein [Thermoplasmata archaeon]
IFLPTSALVLASILFLLVGFLASALLLRAADRPMRREFATSGVALIRPMLDHINLRDPQATEALEEFFSRFSALADLSVSLITFTGEKGRKATIALPTVHPGPFGALGSSDLPRRLSEWLGPKAGTVFVPHTPCNHDLDLPSRREFERVASETEALLGEIPTGPSPSAPRASPLIAGTPTSLARVQILGDVALVLVTQAPGPTDDIDFSVVDPLAKRLAETTGLRLALIDAHNSYIEGQGDLTYGTPMARRLARDLEASLDRARQCLADGPIRAGIGVKDGYSLGRDGIGPAGIRTLVIEAAGGRTAYVLIDGNNLVVGRRAELLEAIRPLAEAAEVMTTDNHIVHEVDGGTNPVGERYPIDALKADVVETVRRATDDLEGVRVASGTRSIPEVRVLQPGWTVRLLTSLGDTLAVFTNAFLTTFLLALTGSLVVLLVFG